MPYLEYRGTHSLTHSHSYLQVINAVYMSWECKRKLNLEEPTQAEREHANSTEKGLEIEP